MGDRHLRALAPRNLLFRNYIRQLSTHGPPSRPPFGPRVRRATARRAQSSPASAGAARWCCPCSQRRGSDHLHLWCKRACYMSRCTPEASACARSDERTDRSNTGNSAGKVTCAAAVCVLLQGGCLSMRTRQVCSHMALHKRSAPCVARKRRSSAVVASQCSSPPAPASLAPAHAKRPAWSLTATAPCPARPPRQPAQAGQRRHPTQPRPATGLVLPAGAQRQPHGDRNASTQV